MGAVTDSLLRARLDTLPAEQLRRLAEPWCDAVSRAGGDAVRDTLSGQYADSLADAAARAADGVQGAAAGRVGAFTEEGLGMIVERWRRARDVFRDVDAATLFGPESSLSYGAQRDSAAVAEDMMLAAGNGSVDGVSGVLSAAGADSLRPAADSIAVAGDSLLFHDGAAAGADSLSAAVPAADGVGGVAASVSDAVTGGVDTAAVASWVADTVQNLLVAVVVFLYIFCLYRYFDDVKALLGSVFRRSVAPSERIIERRRSEIFYGFLGKLFLIGTCALGAIVSLWACRQPVWDGMPPYACAVLPFGAMAAFLSVVAVQYAVLAVAGGITRSWPTMATLLRIRLIYFVLSTVLVMPLLLVSQVDTGPACGVWLRAAAVAGAVAAALYARESITLFISKKISILHWFLYLCIVEIMPFTLLWQIIVRMGK